MISERSEREASHLHTYFFQCLQRDLPAAQTKHLQQLSSEEWQQLVALAYQQRVAPLLYKRLQPYQGQLNMPAAVWQQLELHYYQNAIRNKRILQELGELLTLFRQQQIPVIVLKGACLANTVYPHPGLRVMLDLDLLLPLETINQAVTLLLANGYQPQSALSQVITDYFTILHHLPPFQRAGSPITIELHSTLAAPDRFYAVQPEELWAHAIPIQFAMGEALSLSVEDLLLYTCMHATYRHLLELDARFLCDIDAIVHTYQQVIDWKLVESRARAWRWQNGVYLSLELAHTLLATPLPPVLLQTLRPATFTTHIRAEALALLLGKEVNTAIVSGEFAQKWANLRWYAKVGQAVRTILLSRRKMAAYYPVAANSPKIFLYYPVRVRDLLQQNLPRLRLLWRKDTASTIERKSKLMAWLENA